MKSSAFVRLRWPAKTANSRERSRGFSLIELIVVLGVIALMAAISVPYLVNYRKVYRTDDQAQRIVDLMNEANQLALTRRRTFRFQINVTRNSAQIVDENGTIQGNLIKEVKLEPTTEVRMNAIPTGVTRPNPPNYANAVFANDSIGYREGVTTVLGNNMWIARFRRDGSVVDSTNNLLSATVFIWPPAAATGTTPRNLKEVRALTMFGGSGAIRYWKHNGTTFVAK